MVDTVNKSGYGEDDDDGGYGVSNYSDDDDKDDDTNRCRHTGIFKNEKLLGWQKHTSIIGQSSLRTIFFNVPNK